MTLFAGHTAMSGTHGTPEREPGALKWNIKKTARTTRTPVTEDLWVQHLEGKRPLGIIPIRADNTVVFGNLDYDEYDVDIIALTAKVEQTKLPLVPVRSKSGGLHLFIFLKEPEPAADVRAVLKEAASNLGLAECEIFPKQEKILTERGDFGSWLLMPYFHGTYDGKLQYQHGIKKSGTDMSLGEFCTFAESQKTTTLEFASLLHKKLNGRQPKSSAKRPRGKSPCDFTDGPPCMQIMCSNGSAPTDGRKRLLFNVATYMKKADSDGWKERTEVENQKFNPPLPSNEVSGIIQSQGKKQYEYQCKESPLVEHCNSMLCRTRKHGVGTGGAFPSFDLRKLDIPDEPIWFIEINGKTISLLTRDLLNYSRFNEACAKKINITYPFVDQKTWYATVGEVMERMETVIPPPPDVGEPAQFLELLNEHLTNRSAGRRREDLQRDLPWEEGGKHYFTLRGLARHLEQEGLKGIGRGKMTQLIEGLGGGRHTFNFGNVRSVSCWWVASDKLQVPLLIKPDGPEGEGEV